MIYARSGAIPGFFGDLCVAGGLASLRYDLSVGVSSRGGLRRVFEDDFIRTVSGALCGWKIGHVRTEYASTVLVGCRAHTHTHTRTRTRHDKNFNGGTLETRAL